MTKYQRSHIIDSLFHSGGYATDESREIFHDLSRLERWFKIEGALALAQAEVGILPEDIGQAIYEASQKFEEADQEKIAAEIKRTSHSLVPLLKELQRLSPPEAGEFVHFGATTQDIQDTGQSIELKAVLEVTLSQTKVLMDEIATLAERHQHQLMTGRTHSVPALPVSFGLKAASWLDELMRHYDRLKRSIPEIAVVQLFGGAGTMASFGEKAPELIQAFARHLELEVPAINWHVARDRIAEFTANQAMLTATLARIADEVRLLCRPEIAELQIAWQPGQVGSSTMPHKRNPEDCEQVVVLAQLVQSKVPLALQTMIQEHERDYRATRLEWPFIADTSHYSLTALKLTIHVIKNLEINQSQMEGFAHQMAHALCTESLMLNLAQQLGKQSAYAIIYELSQRSQSEGLSFKDLLLKDERVTLSTENIEHIFDPSNYLGHSSHQVQQVLSNYRQLDF